MVQRELRNEVRTRFNRRKFLKATAVTGASLGGVAAFSGSAAAATIFVSGGGDALQLGIDGASDGDTIIVTDSKVYNPIVVDVEVTIKSAVRAVPKIKGTGVNTAVSIDAEAVTLQGFDVRNPAGLLGIKVEADHDSVTIKNNDVRNVGPTGRLGVTGILVGNGDHDGIEITNNTIQNLDQETTNESGFPTLNGILFDAVNSGPGVVSNTSVDDNRIRDLESDIAPLGIVVQHNTDGVTINDNEIRDFLAADSTDSDPSDSTDGVGSDVDPGFTFAQGINITSESTADTDIKGNKISDIVSEERFLGEAVKIDGNGGGLSFRNNQFLAAIGLNNQNGAGGAPTVDAEDNWWGSPRGPEEAADNEDADDDERADVIGNVDFEPFLRRPPR